MNMQIETIPPYKIAYIRHTGPYGTDNVQTMEDLKHWARKNHLLNDTSIILGIANDNPAATKPEDCRYDTCLVVAEDNFINGETVRPGRVAGGRYAVFEIQHTTEAVQAAWVEIFPELARLGYRPDETRPILERYKAKMVQNHLCEICVPIL